MNLLLRIASWLYGLVVALRNLLYDEHVLHAFQPALPTICVGNLAVGGTGKTPHVEHIAMFLHREGYQVAVLSRGYKRRTVGFVEADEHSTASQIGDEAMQLKRKHPELIVAVCEDRLVGIRRLQWWSWMTPSSTGDSKPDSASSSRRRTDCMSRIICCPSDACANQPPAVTAPTWS